MIQLTVTKSDIISFHCSEMVYHFTVEFSDQIGCNKLIGAIGLHFVF